MKRGKKLLEKCKVIKGTGGRILALAAVFLFAGFLWGQAAGADPALVPGSESDPLVTASWVEAKLAAFSQALKEEQKERQILEDRMKQLEGNGTEQPVPGEPLYITDPAPKFAVIIVPAHKKLLTGEGTEIVLRNGRAQALEGPGGGLSDLTAGANLSSGSPVAKDHLILSPRGDGRGCLTESDTIFLIRGDYEIE